MCSNGSYPIKAYYNDFRIYDHALSAKEVKEISKALILHMSLDNNGAGNENLIKNSTQGAGISQTAYNLQDYNFSKALVNGTTYTISCKINMSSEKKAFAVYHSGSSIMCGPWITNTGSGVYTWSFTATSQMASQTAGDGYGYARVYVSNVNGPQGSVALTGTANVDWIKIEEGEVATPWCPNVTDAEYSSLGFNSSIVYDTSGYGNNGTMSSSKPTSVSDAPRYQSCMLFNGSNNYIACGRGSMVRDAITVNMWAYMDSWSEYTRMASCTEGGGWNFEPGSGKMNFAMGTGVSSNTYKSVLSTQELASLSGWVMFTGTYDGFNTKIYINGVLSNTTAAYTTKTPIFYNASNGLFIGAEAGGNAVTPTGSYFKGKISDFRIYATALSADDIMELYTSPVSIDDGGTIHAYGFTENGAANDVSKHGIVSTGIDRAHYLVPNFSETGNLTGWTVGSGGALTNGVIVLTGTNISVTSTAFPVGANDIICVEFTVSVPTPSTTTSGPGIYIGTQAGQTGRAIAFDFTNKGYNEGTSTGTNKYFLSSYDSTATNTIKTFIIGSVVDINMVRFGERSVTTHGLNIMRILSGDTTYIRTGYNSNTSMVINISNFKIYKINQHGICENAGEKSIGKGYLSFANYNEI
jgi:hypothetical protein